MTGTHNIPCYKTSFSAKKKHPAGCFFVVRHMNSTDLNRRSALPVAGGAPRRAASAAAQAGKSLLLRIDDLHFLQIIVF